MFPFNWFPQRVGTRRSTAIIPRAASFHSIGFPSEWGPSDFGYYSIRDFEVSIQLVSPASGDVHAFLVSHEHESFPFNWFPQRVGTSSDLLHKSSFSYCFHSIGFPSEWGLNTLATTMSITRNVSIQLVSPASGDLKTMRWASISAQRFHSIGFPSEWGLHTWMLNIRKPYSFPFNWFPQRVGTRQRILR